MKKLGKMFSVLEIVFNNFHRQLQWANHTFDPKYFNLSNSDEGTGFKQNKPK